MPAPEGNVGGGDWTSRGHSRLQVEEGRTQANSFDSDLYSTESSLAYNDGPTPIVDEFPIPPNNVILPHPHAPKPVPSSKVVAPAIQRSQSIGSRQYLASTASTEPGTLVETLARAAAIAAQDHYNRGGPSRARNTFIRGHTTIDLLSASGPVPIHFALGDQSIPSKPPTPPETPTPETIPSSNSNASNTSTSSGSSSSNTKLTENPHSKEVTAQTSAFSGILSAIETPSSYLVGRAPLPPNRENVAPLRQDSFQKQEESFDRVQNTPSESSLPSSSRIRSSLSGPQPQIASTSPSSSFVTTSPSLQSLPTPRRLLSKPPPLPVTGYRSRPPQPIRVGSLQHPPGPIDLDNLPPPRILHAAGTSSVPSSPHTEMTPASLHGAKSIPNLRSMPPPSQEPSLPRPSISSVRTRQSSRSHKASTSSSKYSEDGETEGDTLSYHAGILEDYGVELSPNWSPDQIPRGLPRSPSSLTSGSPATGGEMGSPTSMNYPLHRLPNGGPPAPPGPSGSLSPVEYVHHRVPRRPSLPPRSGSSASITHPAQPTSNLAGPSVVASSSSGIPNPPNSPPSPGRTLSLRSKISISAMRNNAASAARRRQDSVIGDRARELRKQETVEVDDMEFTLVGPEIFRNGAPMGPGNEEDERKRTTSETSSQPDFSSITSGLTRENMSLRSKSPSIHTFASQQIPLAINSQPQVSPMSTNMSSPSPTPPTPLLSPFAESFGASPSVTSQTSVSVISDAPSPPFSPSLGTPSFSSTGFPPGTTATKSAPGPIVEVNAENHRQLELKWITAMNSVPSAESGKSKKVKKLVIDGIPASVRGVVWLYLTDIKGRRMKDVYAQLCKRGRLPQSNEIWTDIQSYFPDQPQLRDPEGPLLSLLQAYLRMVPDTVYSYGLTMIAGHLLLQTVEEDAFWTFVSLMDRHLRGYFSPTARLLEVDSILFERAVITFDKALATRLFDDLRVSAADFCQHWFTSLYACVIPTPHLPRVWDAVLYFLDSTFLFRIGLAILNLCRSFIMSPTRCATGADARAFLIRPPVGIFPSSPDAIITSALGAKLKEDELRRLRPKVEAQIKQRHPIRR